MVTSLVSPAVKDAEEEPNVDAPRPRPGVREYSTVQSA